MKKRILHCKKARAATLLLVLLLSHPVLFAQAKTLDLQGCINLALQNNLQVKTATLEAAQNKAMERSSFDPGKTNITLIQDPTSGGNIDNALGVTQSIGLPVLYKLQKKVLIEQTTLAEKNTAVTQAEIIHNVKIAYYTLLYNKQKQKLLLYLDSLYDEFARKAVVRQKTGETSNLEKLAAQNKSQEVRLQQREIAADIQVSQYNLQQLLNTEEPVAIADDTLAVVAYYPAPDTSFLNANPVLGYYNQYINIANAKVQLEKAKLLPEFTFGYSHQLVIKGFNPAGINRDYFEGTRIAGIQAGISVPLFNRAYKARINAEKIGASAAGSRLATARQTLQFQWQQAYQEYFKYKQSFDYYNTNGLQLANEQLRVAQFAFNKGEIGYVEYIQNISMAVQTRLDYLSAVQLLNTAAINLQYLQGADKN